MSLSQQKGNSSKGTLRISTLPSLKVPPIFLLKKAFLKEKYGKLGGTFKEGRVCGNFSVVSKKGVLSEEALTILPFQRLL